MNSILLISISLTTFAILLSSICNAGFFNHVFSFSLKDFYLAYFLCWTIAMLLFSIASIKQFWREF